MSGLLLVDKPAGLTSFDVVRRIRRICNTRRVGHCGTLDPMATGVLPVAVDATTRLVEYLMSGDKVYEATLQLGIVTDTQDATGTVLSRADYSAVDRLAVENGLATLTGSISQLPPMYSALKKNGTPLYKLARQGVDIAREPRIVEIRTIELLEFSPPLVSLRVSCGKGTYIRTLCHDLGMLLGCGAHLTALRRTACGIFTADRCVSLDSLDTMIESGQSLPLLSNAEALADWPGVVVPVAALERLSHGVAPTMSDCSGTEVINEGQLVRLQAGEELAAIARYVPGGQGGRPGDFELLKVFPDAFLSP